LQLFAVIRAYSRVKNLSHPGHPSHPWLK